MKLNRRAFLGSMLATGAGGAYASETADSFLFREDTKKGFSIMQGMTDETSTQLSLLLPKNSNWTIEIPGLNFSSEVFSRPYSGYAAYKISVDGMKLGETYRLLVKGEDKSLWDEREFAALDLSPRPVRLGMLSCILDLLHRDDIWRRFEAQPLDAVLFLGDNVYADRISFITKRPADERQLWERYVLTRNRVLFYYRRRLLPVLATWDDHDFGADNAYRDFPAAAESKVVFETFFPQNDRPSLVSGPGIARRWSAFGADFVLLDGRSFRDPAGTTAAKILGAEQESWLLERAVAGRPTWVFNGSVFFGAYQTSENFEGSYPEDFRSFLEKLAASPALYCFGSGDVHYSEFMAIEAGKIGYPTFELVASSMHSYTFPGHENRFSNPRRLATTSSHNFLVFDGRFADNLLSGELICHSPTREDFRLPVNIAR